MASKDTGGQKRTSKTSEEVEETAVEASTDVAERKEKLDDDIDAMLDEIDDVFETNSEDFVRGFVQKGGQWVLVSGDKSAAQGLSRLRRWPTSAVTRGTGSAQRSPPEAVRPSPQAGMRSPQARRQKSVPAMRAQGSARRLRRTPRSRQHQIECPVRHEFTVLGASEGHAGRPLRARRSQVLSGCERSLPFADWPPMSEHQGGPRACEGCTGQTRHNHLEERYGIGSRRVELMLAAQDGLCAVCRTSAAVHVDHDHVTGEIRGMLCFHCNAALGQFGDDPTVLRRAAATWNKHVPDPGARRSSTSGVAVG